MTRLPVLLAAVLLGGAARAADDPQAVIKAYRFEVRPVEFRLASTTDPFRVILPLQAVASPEAWKVRIISLNLTSVIVGRQRVAIFRELHGPTFSYILLNGVLLGPDRKPVPGVAGSIEALDARGNFVVVLKQGAETVRFTQARTDATGQREIPNEQAKGAGTGGVGASPRGGS